MDENYVDIATPDTIKIHDAEGKVILWYHYRDSKCRPVPYAYLCGRQGDERLVFGDVGQGHSDLEKELVGEDWLKYSLEDRGRIWNNAYITFWYFGGLRNLDELRGIYERVCKDAKNEYGMDLSNYIVIIQSREDDHCSAMAVRMSDFLNGAQPVKYLEFIGKSAPSDSSYEKFANPNDPNDDDYKRRQRMNAWYGRVAEGKKKKPIRINENQLRKIISEVINELLR